ncbi:MAG TPA: hypothetical protein VGR95_17695 [Thermoanaerobaculia bacterium]|jgi:hypothetical protein|nr:hypothetical protein [Thermoanaerobaculia bacterium]
MSAVIADAADRGTVTGSMTVNGTTVQLHHVVALADANPFHSTRKDLVIFLSDVPVSTSDIVKKNISAIWMTGKLNAIRVEVQPWDKQAIGGNLWAAVLAAKGTQITGSGMGDFTATKLTADHVTGHLSTKDYGMSDALLSYDATFDAPIEEGRIDLLAPEPEKEGDSGNGVTSHPAAMVGGKPLPAGGGDAGAAYLSYTKAVQSGAPAAIMKYLPKADRDALAGGDTTAAFSILKDFTPKDAKVAGGKSNGTNAELTVTSSLGNGVVTMVHEADGWKYVNDTINH